MGRGAKISKQLQFNGKTDTDNFEDGTPTELSITYNSTVPNIVPVSGFVIRKDKADAFLSVNPSVDLTQQKFVISAEEMVNPNLVSTPSMNIEQNRFLKTEIALNRGVISIDANSKDENPFKLSSIVQKVFFENP